MSTGGANSCSGSPRLTTTRRRVADFVDAEKAPINPATSISDNDEESDDEPTSSHLHNHSHDQHHHPLIKYVLLRRRMCLLCVPEAWLLRIEDVVYWTASLMQSVISRRKITGRRILGILMMMAVISLFLKVSVMSRVHMDWIGKRSSSSSNRNFIVHFKDDLSASQKIVSEIDDSTTSISSAVSGGSVMPTRVLEKSPIQDAYVTTYETCGQYWPYVHRYIMTGIVLMQITMIGMFGLKSKPAASILTIPLLLLTIMFNEYCKMRFLPSFRKCSIQTAAENDELDEKAGMRESDREDTIKAYRPPFLQPVELRSAVSSYTEPLLSSVI